MWRAARFTKSYADPDTSESEENFEDGLDFHDQEEEEDVAGIRRRMSDEAAVSRVGEALNQTLGADRDEEAAPRDHFSPVQVRFPVNAPALRPPPEEVVEGHVVGGSDADNGAEGGAGGAGDGNPGDEGAGDDDMANYDVEDKADSEKAADLARSIRVEFDPNDIRFWFAQLEDEMEVATIGRQWLKKTVLQRNLPVKQKEDVKGYLIRNKNEAGDHIYFNIKTDLIRIYAPKPSDSYRKALTRTMVGLPSQLGLQIVDDICKKSKKLDGCCCAAAALALWSLQLPVNVRAHISNKNFDKDTYRRVFEAADKVYLSSKQVTVAAVARPVSMDETLPALSLLPAFTEQNQPQVAAIKGQNQNNKNQGQGKSQKKNKNKKGQQGQGQAMPRGPRHSSMPPESCCDRHYVHGDQAWYCLAPTTCPWVSRVTPRAT